MPPAEKSQDIAKKAAVSERTSPRTKRVNVFCTPKEKEALKKQAAEVDKPLNQHILDTLGVAEIDVTTRFTSKEAA